MINSFRFDNIGEEYKAATLSNGLEVRVVEKPEFCSCYAAFAVNYGGVDRRFELDGKLLDTPAGIAHYLEHKLFDMPNGDNSLAVLTANGADPNAFTSSVMTCYYFQCTEGFYENLQILLNFVTTPYFTPETVDKERGIIGQEIMMGLDNPDRALYYNLLRLLYRNHPIKDEVAGSVESISRITAQTLYDCHRAFYCPGNMVLCVEGNVSAEKVVEVAEKTLSGWKSSPVPCSDYGESDGLIPYSERVSVKLPVSEKQFLIGAKVIPTAGDYTRQQLSARLGLQVMLGPSSEFYNRLYAEGLINQSFNWDIDYAAGVATIMIGGESPDPDAVLAELETTVEKIGRDGLDPVLFLRAKKASIGGSLRDFEDFDNVCIGMAEGIFNNFCIFEAPAILEALSIEECSGFIAEHLSSDRLAISIVEPV